MPRLCRVGVVDRIKNGGTCQCEERVGYAAKSLYQYIIFLDSMLLPLSCDL